MNVADSPRRLHWATTCIPAIEQVQKSLIPAFVASFVVGPWNVVLFYGLFVIATAGYFLMKYWTVTFEIHDKELIIHSGWMNRRERRIPYDKIQEVELQQGLLRRPFAITALQIKTAGSDESEASLDAITMAEAQAVQRHCQSLTSQSVAADILENDTSTGEGDFDFECRLTFRDLVVGGLTSNVVATVGAIVFALGYFQLFLGRGQDWFSFPRIPGNLERLNQVPEDWSETIQGWIPNLGPFNFLVEFAFSETLFRSIGLAIAGLTAAVLTFVIRYYGFRLRRLGDAMTVSSGLFTLRQNGLSRLRVQSLKVEEGFLRRMLGLAAVRVDSAGDRASVDDNKKRDVLLPVARRAIAGEVAREVVPGLHDFDFAPVESKTLPVDATGQNWSRISPLAVSRGSKKGWVAVLLCMFQAYFWVGWYALAMLPLFPLVYGLNRQWYRHTGYRMEEEHFLFCEGWLNRSTLCLPIKNIQSVLLSRSPFDRRLGLATLSIDTAGQSNTGGGPVIRHLPVDTAVRLRKQLSRRVAATEFGW